VDFTPEMSGNPDSCLLLLPSLDLPMEDALKRSELPDWAEHMEGIDLEEEDASDVCTVVPESAILL